MSVFVQLTHNTCYAIYKERKQDEHKHYLFPYRCTVVNSYRVFWVKQRSPVITFVRRNCVRNTEATTKSSRDKKTESTPRSVSTTTTRASKVVTSTRGDSAAASVTPGQKTSDTTINTHTSNSGNTNTRSTMHTLFHLIATYVALVFLLI